VCQLEGSDHGGRDSAAELALAGTIDVQVSENSCNRLTLGSAASDGRNYTPPHRTVNGFIRKRIYSRLFESDIPKPGVYCLLEQRLFGSGLDDFWRISGTD